MGIYAASLRSWAYSVSKSPEICFFLACRKIKRLISIILQFGRIPTESRSCGLKWILSGPQLNCLKCEKKSCFCEERSDLILSHTSEILSEFAEKQVWWRLIFLFFGKARKNRFRAIWTLNKFKIAKMPHKFPWTIIASVAYLTSKISEILNFSHFSKNQASALIIFQIIGQILKEVRSCHARKTRKILLLVKSGGG